MGLGFDFSGFFAGFGLMWIFSAIITILVIAVFVVVFVKIISQWSKNNNSPKLTVPAAIVAKRTSVSHHHHHDHHHMHSTSYYVTFQVESGDRMELIVSGQDFGLLVEGDQGMLTFQGTRYLGFQRT
ncbi:MAG: DUF2500 domain-containing protein [Clostridia bacterium]|nr:DUF2500 domain-containing protein [Clostridia bacterium]